MLAAAFFLAALLAIPASPQARAAFQRGEKALEAGQLDEAQAAYREALSSSPWYAEALNGLGSVLFRQGKRAEAMSKFEAAIAADPGLKLAHFNLGYAARKNGDFAVAAQAYETYVKLDPTDSEGYFGLAESYRNQGKADAAVQAYEKYLALESRPSEQRWVDKAKESIAQLKAQPAAAAVPAATSPAVATPAAPSTVAAGTSSALISEGDKALRAGNASAAVQSYQAALQLDPTSVEALFKEGNALAKLGDYRPAIEKWERVVQLSEDPALRKSAQENVDKARARLSRAAPAAGSPQARGREAYERGVHLVVRRDYGAAVQALSDALAADPTLAAAYTARGSANVGLRRFFEAAADYQDALRLDPTRAAPLFGLAEAYRALGRAADARVYYDRYAASTAADAQPALQATARTNSAALAGEGSGATALPPH